MDSMTYRVQQGTDFIELQKSLNTCAVCKQGETHFTFFTATNEELDILRQKNSKKDIYTHVYSSTGDNSLIVPNGKIYLKCKHGTLKNVAKQYGLRRVDKNLYISTKENPIKVCAKMYNDCNVLIGEPDMEFEITTLNHSNQITATQYLNQWHLHSSGKATDYAIDIQLQPNAAADMSKTWDKYGFGSEDVVVGIVDNAFLNVPDISQDRIVATYSMYRNNDDVSPLEGLVQTHGTNVAGVIAADIENEVVGVAPNVKVAYCQFSSISGESLKRGFYDFLIERANVDVITNSWGVANGNFRVTHYINDLLHDIATNARDGKGVTILFAAGNSFKAVGKHSFAGNENTISVSGMSSLLYKSSYSNWQADISAPTSPMGIVTSNPETILEDGTKRYFTTDFGGTSSACPYVAGVVALMYSVNKNLTSQQAREILFASSAKVGLTAAYDDIGYSEQLGYGRIDPFAALEMAEHYNVKNVTTKGGVRPQFPTIYRYIKSSKPSRPYQYAFSLGCGKWEITLKDNSSNNTLLVTKGFMPAKDIAAQYQNHESIAEKKVAFELFQSSIVYIKIYSKVKNSRLSLNVRFKG